MKQDREFVTKVVDDMLAETGCNIISPNKAIDKIVVYIDKVRGEILIEQKEREIKRNRTCPYCQTSRCNDPEHNKTLDMVDDIIKPFIDKLYDELDKKGVFDEVKEVVDKLNNPMLTLDPEKKAITT